MFEFKSPINPRKPLDESDPPPDGWREVDSKDYSKALFGSPSPVFEECRSWEERELRRLGYEVVLTEGRMSDLGMVYRRTVRKIEGSV